ncbi:hypothetical protein [Caldimonas brevitalea]|uniref:Uncharacterized protein n=1 Tax=Caldimonas brevitalea TaxID=413882 RepID=A0A0G3BQQ4_9BURK|nr:hypothetical protein [Caldimonas brevitalea]AKJ30288.1 hypothetical protein AAW51_3597 [Caldimonas brevitalea]
MTGSLFAVIGTVLLGAAGSVGVMAVKKAAAQEGLGPDEVQFVRCADVRQEFTHAPHPAQVSRPVWVLTRSAGGTSDAFCGGGDGEQTVPGLGTEEPDWLVRRPGVVGLPRLLV